jgi:hypothetical protein
VHARYALLGSRSVLDSRRPSQCGRAVPVGPPLALALAAIPIRTVAAQASPRHRRSRLKLRLVSVARGWVSTKYTARRPPPMYVELRTPGVPQAETPVLRPIVSRNVPDAIHNSDQSPAPIGQDRRTGDAQIVGYYVSYVQLCRLVALVYIRQPLRHRSRAKRRAGALSWEPRPG